MCLTTFTSVMSFDSRSKGSILCSLHCVRHATVHSFKGRARYKTVCIHHNSTKAKLWSNSGSEFQMFLFLAIPSKELLFGLGLGLGAYIMFFNLYLPIFDRVDIKQWHPLTSCPHWKDSSLWLPFMWHCERLLCLLMRGSVTESDMCPAWSFSQYNAWGTPQRGLWMHSYSEMYMLLKNACMNAWIKIDLFRCVVCEVNIWLRRLHFRVQRTCASELTKPLTVGAAQWSGI